MTTPADAAIDLSHVSKRYGRWRGGTHALYNVSLRVDRGEVFGLLGPNGAGKSTLIKIMMTVVRPTTAVGTLLGRPVGHKPTLAKVGYLPEHHRFPRYLTGRQTLEFFAALAGVDRRTRVRRAATLADQVGMTTALDRPVGTYSKGMMQRIGIAQALANDPDLILLDEPTDGVDPLGRRDIRDIVSRLASEGKTVFLNSHLLGELEAVCTRVAMLVDGRVALQGDIDGLTAGRRWYEVDVADAVGGDPGERLRQVVAAASPAGIAVAVHGRTIDVRTDDPAAVQPLIDAARAAGLVVTRVKVMRPSLEDLFIERVTNAGPQPMPPGPVPPVVGYST